MISKPTIYATVRVFLYAIPVIVAALIIKSDAGLSVDGFKFGETSKTELTQQLLLLLTSIAFISIGLISKSHKAIAFLFGGGVLVALTREVDAFFDLIYHGAWLPVAILIAGITIFLTVRQRKQLKQNLEEFVCTPAFGILLSGFLSVFIFSRIFGAQKVWKAIFEVENLNAIQRWVKNAAEEGSELFGYTLLFIAAVELFIHIAQFRLANNLSENSNDKDWLAQQLNPR